jgi:NADH-quinone oxidoreductase subunit K
MAETALLYRYLFVGCVIFGVGLVGFVCRRNMIVMLLSAEMMLQGISLSLVGWGRYHGDWGGQMLVVMIIAVAACEAAIGLALVVALYQRSGQLDIALWHHLREADQPPFVDRELPAPEPAAPQVWPTLPRAGVPLAEPEVETFHRSHV